MNINFIGQGNKKYTVPGIEFTNKQYQNDFNRMVNNSKIGDLEKNVKKFLQKHKNSKHYKAIA
ncbi:MAG: hypothetical protein ABIH00_10700, partial [Armatimonadota bacterium]